MVDPLTEPGGDDELIRDMNRSIKVLMRALELKSRMLKLGKTSAWTTCTIDGCTGKLSAVLVPPKNHGRYTCDGCGFQAME